MKTVYITELAALPAEHDSDCFVLELTRTPPKDCIGCWNCWLKTPGRCVHHDLDDFYRAYLNADTAVFYIKPSMGFVSGNLKTLFDRMIPHLLPYIRYGTEESRHISRYEKYPDVEVYYENSFLHGDEKQNFEDYLARVFNQFNIKNTTIRELPADESEVTL